MRHVAIGKYTLMWRASRLTRVGRRRRCRRDRALCGSPAGPIERRLASSARSSEVGLIDALFYFGGGLAGRCRCSGFGLFQRAWMARIFVLAVAAQKPQDYRRNNKNDRAHETRCPTLGLKNGKFFDAARGFRRSLRSVRGAQYFESLYIYGGSGSPCLSLILW